MRDRAIGIADLNQLRLWIDSRPEVPEGDWFKDFGSFKIYGRGSLSQTSMPEADCSVEGDQDSPRTLLRPMARRSA